MAKVTMEGLGEAECADGRRLVLCIEDAGGDILHRCGGNARCTTCRVDIIDGDAGPMTDAEAAKLATLGDISSSLRLSCQVQVREDITVRVLRQLRDNPDMGDPGPRPIEWPAEGPLPPD
ncbi:MAG: (2Fe-2S)-binding protein [Chloroflexota bacterium]|nr:(2Fe-2S)-binding protein [Chloroflexota bacterium]